MAGQARRGRNLWYPVAMTLVVIVGIALIVVSRPNDGDSSDPLADQRPYYGDSWTVAYGVFACDAYIESFPDSTLDTEESGGDGDGNGINTKGDGFIHLEPLNEDYIGKGANLGAFADSVGMTLTDDSVTLPDGTTYTNGDDCGGEPGELQVKTWTNLGDTEGETTTKDLAEVHPANQSLVAIVFAPEGTEIGQPPSASGSPATTTTTTEPPTTTTVGPAPATTTTASAGP